MALKNKYVDRSKVSEAKFRKLVRRFADGMDASKIAQLGGLNRNTVNRYIKAIRKRIAEHCIYEPLLTRRQRMFLSTIGYRYFVKFKRSNSGSSSSPVFGIANRDGRIHTEIIKGHHLNIKLRAVIRGVIPREHVLSFEGFDSYDALVDVGHDQPFHIDNSKSDDCIDNFWDMAKGRLAMFRGVRQDAIELYLKECEFRYNCRDQNLYLLILKIIGEEPLFKRWSWTNKMKNRPGREQSYQQIDVGGEIVKSASPSLQNPDGISETLPTHVGQKARERISVNVHKKRRQAGE